MKKILFPTDFSPASLNAFIYALRFASKMHAEIITLHVYELPVGAYTDYYDYLTENYKISDIGQFENFKDEVPKLREIAERESLGHVKISHMLEKGEVVETILGVQVTERIDYIIMGTKGASGLKEIFIGSVAEEVINRATASVLAIPDKCTYRPTKNILFLTDYENSQLDTLKKVAHIAQLFKAHVDVLQVKSHHEAQDEEILAKWKADFISDDVRFNILASKSVEETVLDFMELEHTDLVAMAVRHKGFLERLFLYSLSRNLAYHSEVPVLAIPRHPVRKNKGDRKDNTSTIIH